MRGFETRVEARNNARVLDARACIRPRWRSDRARCSGGGRRGTAALACFAACMLAASALPACAAKQTAATVAMSQPPVPDDRAPIEWARDEEMFVVVRRSCRTLTVYRHGDWLRTYEKVSFGREPGTKLYEGDRRTPSGLYRIVGRRVHPRWSRFLLLDYPNLKDEAVHGEAFAAGLAPASPGNQVGIHGTDEPQLNEHGVDWTFGCVSLRNRDVKELYDLVPDGTLVLIED
jgi:murein L,D-transpeptidase YafK